MHIDLDATQSNEIQQKQCTMSLPRCIVCKRGLRDRNAVRLSIRLSVRPAVRHTREL